MKYLISIATLLVFALNTQAQIADSLRWSLKLGGNAFTDYDSRYDYRNPADFALTVKEKLIMPYLELSIHSKEGRHSIAFHYVALKDEMFQVRYQYDYVFFHSIKPDDKKYFGYPSVGITFSPYSGYYEIYDSFGAGGQDHSSSTTTKSNIIGVSSQLVPSFRIQQKRMFIELGLRANLFSIGRTNSLVENRTTWDDPPSTTINTGTVVIYKFNWVPNYNKRIESYFVAIGYKF